MEFSFGVSIFICFITFYMIWTQKSEDVMSDSYYLHMLITKARKEVEMGRTTSAVNTLDLAAKIAKKL